MLEGKTALVTGSTRNTGFGIARVLARYGAHVFVNGRTEEAVGRAIERLEGETPGAFSAAVGDIAGTDGVERIFEAVASGGGRLDILVNNACHLGVGPSALETSVEFFDDVFRVNVRGSFLCSQHAARLMGAGGAIVNIGSAVAGRAIRNRLAYVASKGAIEAMTRALALELAPAIRVNCVLPGFINTERWDELSDEIASLRRSIVPLGKEATARDVGEAVAFLASDRAANATGTTLTLCGGMDVQFVPRAMES